MKFTMARCIACNNYITDISRLLAYRLVCRDHGCATGPNHLEMVDLRGKEPWVGIRVICKDCLDFFRPRR